MTASFSSAIDSAGAITLTTPSGQVFQSHPIGLYYFDSVSGKVAQIGLVQGSQGLFYAPNIIVFTNVLSGVDADLMLVWAKNGFEQNLVLKQAPPSPESFGLSSASSHLQFWTAVDQWPDPLEDRPILLASGLTDHIFFFSDCWLPVGSAFAFGALPLPAPGQPAAVRLLDPSDTNALRTAKSLVTIAGQKVLVEEINYADLLPAFKGLQHASLFPSKLKAVGFASRRQLLPGAADRRARGRSMQAASGSYTARGVLLDYQLSGSASSFTFTNGVTYCISNSFSVGLGGATLQPGTCVKFATNAYLSLTGPVSTPSTNNPAVLTSVDDNAYGDRIQNSTANPNYAARQAIIMSYNDNGQMALTNLLIRWAQVGIDWEEDPGYNGTVSSTAFQDCQTALLVDMPSDTLYLSNDVCCSVATQVSLSHGTVSGSLTTNCGVVSVAMVNDPNQDSQDSDPTHDKNKNTESECTFILANNSQTIVAAFSDTHLDEPNYGSTNNGTIFTNIPAPRSTYWSLSTNGGTWFTNTQPLPPSPTNMTSAWQGDAPNPVMCYDPGVGSSGTIYLLCNCSRESNSWMGFRLWTSTDKGQTFSLVNTNIPGGAWGISNVDRPMLKVNLSTHELYAAGLSIATVGGGVFATCSTNGGASWGQSKVFDADAQFTDIVITPGGTVYVTWVASALTNSGYSTYSNSVRYAWLLPGSSSWSGPTNLGITLNSALFWGQRQALRFNGDASGDWFQTLPFPRTAYANGHIYLVYSDLPSTTSTTDQGDIFLAEAAMTNSDGSLTLTTVRTVNNDHTQTDQWDPAIAVKPGGTELFIGYYSRQNDPTNNSLIMAYGAKGDVANGLANATFDCFPISPTAFQPLFAGTNSVASMQYDPVYPASGAACWDAYARISCFPSSGRPISCQCMNTILGSFGNPNWFQDDNTWADAGSNYFYYAWCDRSRTWTNVIGGTNCTTRVDADVKLGKIAQ